MEEVEDSSPMDQNTQSIIPSKEVEDSSLMNIIPTEEAQDFFLMNPSTFKQYPKRRQKILPQSIPSEEVEDSSSKSLAKHEESKRFFPSGSHMYTTPQWVHPYYSSVSFSSPSKSWEAEDSSPCTSTPQQVFTIPNGPNNQDYSYTYPPRVEHAGTVEKRRDNDRERDQGQPEARASPEKVEKEVKKTRGTSCPEKFKSHRWTPQRLYPFVVCWVSS